MPKGNPPSKADKSKAFERISGDYDRYRSKYPDELIDAACKSMNLKRGDEVLELGSGSGQLTGSLLARGLGVTAVELGRNLMSLAKKNTKVLGRAKFINENFEDASLLDSHYKAVFSAAAFHWMDPDKSWRKAADVLEPGGVLALMQVFGLSGEDTDKDLGSLLAEISKVSPEMAANWPRYYSLEEIISGAEERRDDISELWSWLGGYDLQRPYVRGLFSSTSIKITTKVVEQTPDQVFRLISTVSAFADLDAKQRSDLKHGFIEAGNRLGHDFRSSTVGVVAMARRI